MGASDIPCDAPNAPMMGGITGASDTPHDAPMLCFDNLAIFHQIVKKQHGGI